MSQFEFLSLVTILIFEFCHNMSSWVLSQFGFLSFVTIWVFEFQISVDSSIKKPAHFNYQDSPGSNTEALRETLNLLTCVQKVAAIIKKIVLMSQKNTIFPLAKIFVVSFFLSLNIVFLSLNMCLYVYVKIFIRQKKCFGENKFWWKKNSKKKLVKKTTFYF